MPIVRISNSAGRLLCTMTLKAIDKSKLPSLEEICDAARAAAVEQGVVEAHEAAKLRCEVVQ